MSVTYRGKSSAAKTGIESGHSVRYGDVVPVDTGPHGTSVRLVHFLNIVIYMYIVV